ncbi:hypothetical protein EUX98_g2569 [Antrodiella citrinella]|uniref:Uncharacterized protein n=1 Tax=Antrodiella citrinella TaxID=2447956 RepID=A0A4S4N0U6_9APHY|nr:hypothetical protein EUX98_g2569 [Antrodiella citrinella]
MLSELRLDTHSRSSPSLTLSPPGLRQTRDTCAGPSARRSLECAVRSAIKRSHVVAVSKLSRPKEIRSIVRVADSFKHTFRFRHGKSSYSCCADKSIHFVSARTNLAHARQALVNTSLFQEAIEAPAAVPTQDVLPDIPSCIETIPSALAESAAELERSRCEVLALKTLLQQRESEIDAVNASLVHAQSDLISAAQRCDTLQASLDTYIHQDADVSASDSSLAGIQGQVEELSHLLADELCDEIVSLEFCEGDSLIFTSPESSHSEDRTNPLEVVVQDMFREHDAAKARLTVVTQERDDATTKLRHSYALLQAKREAVHQIETMQIIDSHHTARISELEADLASAQAENRTTSERVTGLESLLTDVSSRLDHSRDVVNHFARRCDHLQATHDWIKLETHFELAQFKKEASAARQEAAAAKHALSMKEITHTTAIADAQDQVRSVSEKIFTAYDYLESRLTGAQEDLAAAKQEVAAERSIKTTLLERFVALNATHDALVVRHDEVTEQLRSYIKRLTSVQKAFDSQKCTSQRRTAKMLELVHVAKDFRAKHAAAVEEIASLQQAMEVAQSGPVPPPVITTSPVDLQEQLDQERCAKGVQIARCLEFKEQVALRAEQIKQISKDLEVSRLQMRSYQHHNQAMVREREETLKKATELREERDALIDHLEWYVDTYGMPPEEEEEDPENRDHDSAYDTSDDEGHSVLSTPVYVLSPLSRLIAVDSEDSDGLPASAQGRIQEVKKERKFRVSNREELRRQALLKARVSYFEETAL